MSFYEDEDRIMAAAKFALDRQTELEQNQDGPDKAKMRFLFMDAMNDLLEDILGPIERCSDCRRVTRIDDEPVDTDAADGGDGMCGNCADRAYNENED